MDGLNAVYMKRYRSRKAKAKEEFLANGGETDVARARANIPKGMSEEDWNKTVDYFLTKEHKDRSCANKSNRQKQLYTNHGGSSTYSIFCFKKDKTRLEAFKNGQTLKDGRFASDPEEQKYEELQAEFESQSEPNIEGEFGEGSSSQVNEVQVFEKVFGPWREHYIGMGHKPSLSRFAPPSCVGPHENEQTPLAHTEVKLDQL
ncbi:putative transposase, Ptta/En/Spm, plant [Helianthus anomalus]